MRRGLVLVVSAPSGAGKTTLCQKLLAADPEISFSVSYTTRKPRPHEKNGVDYFFVDQETFERMIAERAFLEWAKVYDHYYGTAKAQVEEAISQGRDILLDIDVQGAFQVRKKLGQDAVLVFVLPPSLTELEKRLRSRGTEDEETIKRRLSFAQQEIARAKEFDYLVCNQELARAFDELWSVLKAERQRSFRRQDLLKRLS